MFKRVASKFNFKNDIKNVEEPPENKSKRAANNEDYGQFVDIDIYYPENKRPKVLSTQATTSTSNLSDDISDKTIASIEEPVQFTDIPKDVGTQMDTESELSSITASEQSGSDISWVSKISKEKSAMSLQFDMEL